MCLCTACRYCRYSHMGHQAGSTAGFPWARCAALPRPKTRCAPSGRLRPRPRVPPCPPPTTALPLCHRGLRYGQRSRSRSLLHTLDRHKAGCYCRYCCCTYFGAAATAATATAAAGAATAASGIGGEAAAAAAPHGTQAPLAVHHAPKVCLLGVLPPLVPEQDSGKVQEAEVRPQAGDKGQLRVGGLRSAAQHSTAKMSRAGGGGAEKRREQHLGLGFRVLGFRFLGGSWEREQGGDDCCMVSGRGEWWRGEGLGDWVEG